MYTRPTAPRSIGGVIDDAIKLYRASFRAVLVPAIVGAVLAAMVGVWMQLRLPDVASRADFAAMLAAFGTPGFKVANLALMLISIWMGIAITGAVLRVSHGDSPTVGDTLGSSLRMFPAALLGSILLGLGVCVGLVLLVIPGLYLMGRWMCFGTALMDERGSGVQALGRSWRLTQGHWWRSVAVLSVACLLIFVVTMIGSMLIGIAMAIARADRTTLMVVTVIVQGILRVLMAAAAPAALVAIYLDLSLRREGGDLAARVEKLA